MALVELLLLERNGKEFVIVGELVSYRCLANFFNLLPIRFYGRKPDVNRLFHHHQAHA